MIKKSDVKDMYTLSPMQEGMLFHYLADRESAAYFEQMAYRVAGEIRVELFERAFMQIIERYDILRTIFVYEHVPRPLQVVLKTRKPSVYYRDISSRAELERRSWLKDFKDNDKKRNFDLSRDILVRLAIFKLGDREYELVFSFHHILMDGWCIDLITKDLLFIYSHLRNGEPARLPAVTPYRDYIEWLEKQDKEKGLHYWKAYLDGYDSPALLPGNQRGKSETGKEHRSLLHPFKIDRELTAGFNKIAAENNTTINTLFQVLWGILLQTYNNTDDVVFGAVVSGRPPELPEVETMVGLFINTVPVRICHEPPERFSHLLKRVQARNVVSRAHEYLPLAKIQANSSLKRDLLNHIVIFENYPEIRETRAPGQEGDINLSIIDIEAFEQSNYDLEVVIAPPGPDGELALKIRGNPLLYGEDTLLLFEEHLLRLSRQVAAQPGIRVQDLEIVPETWKKQQLLDLNRQDTPHPEEKTILQWFRQQAARHPDKAAVTACAENKAGMVRCTGTLTYRELNDRADELAARLGSQGIGSETIIGIMAAHAPETIAGILGILKAGGVYLPLNPGHPPGRTRYLLQDSAVDILLVQNASLQAKLQETGFAGRVIGLENRAGNWQARDTGHEPAPHHLAYVMYTSGSTGKPKGVAVTHRNVSRLVDKPGFINWVREDRLLLTGAVAFDITTFEIWGPLTNGASLYTVEETILLEPGKFGKVITGNEISILHLIPQLFNQMFPLHPEMFARLTYFLVGGDLVSPGYIEGLRVKYPQVNILHMYGPTENTTFSTFFPVEKAYPDTIPLGKPLNRSWALVLDRYLRLQPPGIAGELVVGGDGLARGYLNNPGLTAERFLSFFNRSYKSYKTYISPKSKHHSHHSPLYKTGDLAKRLQDGNIEFLGRGDSQVKIRGFRVEPGEIEHVLVRHRQIKDALITAVRHDPGSPRPPELCAYFTSTKESAIPGLREYLLDKLPPYMIPTYFVQLEKFPLLSNGKIDKNALPAPERQAQEHYQGPAKEVEEKLAEVWQGVLGIKPISVTANFFQCGGDSIKAIQIVSRLLNHRLKLEVKDLFANPTIKQLAPLARPMDRVQEQRLVRGEVKLTPIQFHFFDHIRTDRHLYIQSVILHRPEGFDPSILERALAKLLEHHDALRMVFKGKGQEVSQWNRGLEAGTFRLQVMPINGEKTGDLETTLGKEISRLHRAIDLENGPLLRAGLFKTGRGDYLAIAIHHLVIDTVSWRILLEDFAALYTHPQSGGKDQNPALPLKTTSYLEWSEKLLQYANSREFLKELPYWRHLEQTVVEPLPRDKNTVIPGDNINDTGSTTVELSAADTGKLLKEVHQAYRTGVIDLILAALGLAYREWTGSGKMLLDLEGHGREEIIKDVDITRTVGWFTSLYPVILEIHHPTDPGTHIKKTREILRQIPRNGIGHGILKYLTTKENKENITFNLKPEMGFNYLGQFDQDLEMNRSLFRLAEIPLEETGAAETARSHPLDIVAMVLKGIFTVTIAYRGERFTEAAIRTFARQYKNALEEILRHCTGRREAEISVSDLSSSRVDARELETLFDILEK